MYIYIYIYTRVIFIYFIDWSEYYTKRENSDEECGQSCIGLIVVHAIEKKKKVNDFPHPPFPLIITDLR